MLYPTVLGSGEIRLAALLPGELGDDIKCEIFRVSWLTEPEMPEYKALSYSWGLQSSRPPTILVNDCRFRVTPNLECALRHLRRPDEVVILWVDALVSPELTHLEMANLRLHDNIASTKTTLGNELLRSPKCATFTARLLK